MGVSRFYASIIHLTSGVGGGLLTTGGGVCRLWVLTLLHLTFVWFADARKVTSQDTKVDHGLKREVHAMDGLANIYHRTTLSHFALLVLCLNVCKEGSFNRYG